MNRLIKENLFVSALLLFILMFSFYDVFFLQKTFKITTASAQAMYNGPYGQENNKPKFIPVNGTDSPVQEEPVLEFIKQNLRRGIVPLWNPHQACGYPLIAAIEAGMFFPLNLIMYLLPEFFAWDVLILARFLLGGILTFHLMRTLRFSRIPALVSAIAFMLSGPMVQLQYWTANVDILAPLVLIGMERLTRNLNRFNIAFLAVTVALTIFAGHPEHIFLVNVYATLFFIFRTLTVAGPAKFLKLFTGMTASYALAVGLSACVLFPFIQNLNSEFWHGHPPLVGLLNEEQGGRILSLALPYFFNNVPLAYDFEFSGWWGGYLGILPLALAFLSLWQNQRRGLNYFFFVLGFLILSKAYGYFYINWIGYLPLFNLCRYAIHTPHLVALTTAILAGMGVRVILGEKKLFFKGLFFSAGLLAWAFFHLIAYRADLRYGIALKAFYLAAAVLCAFQMILWLKDKKIFNARITGIVLVIFLTLELFLYIHRERPKRFESFGKVPYIEFLKNTPPRSRAYGILGPLYPNTATGFEIDDLGIFFGLLPDRYVTFINTLIKEDQFVPDLRPPALRAVPLPTTAKYFLDLLNVRYIITPTPEALSRLIKNYDPAAAEAGNPPIYKNEVFIYERPSAFPRAYVVHKAIFQPDTQAAFGILTKFQQHLREFAVINAPPINDVAEKLTAIAPEIRSSAEIKHYEANEVVVEADLNAPGFLILADAYHTDWKVTVDGKREKLYAANNLMRAVYLTAGKHEVKFTFQPIWFMIGLGLGLFSLGAVLTMMLRPRAGKRS